MNPVLSLKRKKSVQQNSESIPHIPSSVINDILSYLPLKTVVQSKIVCKVWKNLISNPHFAKTYFAKSRRGLFLHSKSSGNVLHFVELWDTSSRFKLAGDVYIPHKVIMGRFLSTKVEFGKCFISSCNGLLCFCEARPNPSYHICNPITGDYTIIPPLDDRSSYRHGQIPKLHWRSEFGFSPKTDQFKVLRLSYSRKADVFTLGKRSWRSIAVPNNFNPYGTTAFLNGTFHWLSFCEMILSFDVGAETFQEFPFPPKSDDHDKSSFYNYSLGILEECISLCCGDYKKGHIEIWMMKEYGVGESWIKQFVIDDASKFVNRLRVQWVMEDGENVLLVCSRNTLVTYDPAEGVCRFIKFDGLWGSLTLFPHVPSLSLLKDVIIFDENSKDENEARSPERSVDSEPPLDIDTWRQQRFNHFNPQKENGSPKGLQRPGSFTGGKWTSSLTNIPSSSTQLSSFTEVPRHITEMDELAKNNFEFRNLLIDWANKVAAIRHPRGPPASGDLSKDTPAILPSQADYIPGDDDLLSDDDFLSDDDILSDDDMSSDDDGGDDILDAVD